MLRRIATGDIMTRKLTRVKPTTSVHQCAKELVKDRVNTLLITEGKKLVGILTSRDILWAITKKPKVNLKDVKAMDIAKKKVAVIKPSASISQAFQKMKKYGFKRLPVITKGEVVGILTVKDILKVDPSVHHEMEKLMNSREVLERERKLVSPDEWDSEGLCAECDAFAPLLKVENRLLCPDCRDELY